MEEKSPHPYASPGNGIDVNGRPITDYGTKYDLSPEQVEKMKTKYGNKDWVAPSSDAEREFVLDGLIG